MFCKRSFLSYITMELFNKLLHSTKALWRFQLLRLHRKWQVLPKKTNSGRKTNGITGNTFRYRCRHKSAGLIFTTVLCCRCKFIISSFGTVNCATRFGNWRCTPIATIETRSRYRTSFDRILTLKSSELFRALTCIAKNAQTTVHTAGIARCYRVIVKVYSARIQRTIMTLPFVSPPKPFPRTAKSLPTAVLWITWTPSA